MQNGIELHIVAGEPGGTQLFRDDSAVLDWVTYVRSRRLRIGPAVLELGSTRNYWREGDAVIVPHMGTSLDAFLALSRKRRIKVGVWGHIASYVSARNALDSAVERWQLHRADQVFAYTQGGAAYAAEQGVPKAKITNLMNTVDTEQLSSDISQLTTESLKQFRYENKIPKGPFLCFIGGLDSSKRIKFLAKTLDILHEQGSSVHIVFGGSGSEAHVLQAAEMRGQVTILGYVKGKEKATLLSASSAIVCPGRIGLLAVEALTSHKPIFTTDWQFHAPEYEYLTEGITVFPSRNSEKDYANHLQNFQEIISKSRGSRDSPLWSAPTIPQMVSNFVDGVSRMLPVREPRP